MREACAMTRDAWAAVFGPVSGLGLVVPAHPGRVGGECLRGLVRGVEGRLILRMKVGADGAARKIVSDVTLV